MSIIVITIMMYNSSVPVVKQSHNILPVYCRWQVLKRKKGVLISNIHTYSVTTLLSAHAHSTMPPTHTLVQSLHQHWLVRYFVMVQTIYKPLTSSSQPLCEPNAEYYRVCVVNLTCFPWSSRSESHAWCQCPHLQKPILEEHGFMT